MRKITSPSVSLEKWLPQLVISPALVISLIFFYALAVWVGVISFTDSHSLPSYSWVSFSNYATLWRDDDWWVAVLNLLKFLPLAVGIPLVLGCLLAILLDRKIRGEGFLRTVYMYPVALSFVVSGTVWRWLLAPDTGIQTWLQAAGIHGASFDWLISPDKAIFTLAIVSVWQSTGFVLALFMAGLRSVDDSLFKAAMLDGATLPRIYWRIVLPILRPTVFSAVMILLPTALRTFDLVVVLTNGGPGRSSILPAYYMFDMFFHRDEMGQGAASGMILLMMCSVVVMPYLFNEFRKHRHEAA